MTASQALFSIAVGVAVSLVTVLGGYWLNERAADRDRKEREKHRLREDRTRALTSFIAAFSDFSAEAIAFRSGSREGLHLAYARVEAARRVLALYFPQHVLTAAVNVAQSCLLEDQERGADDFADSFEEDVMEFIDQSKAFLGDEYPSMQLAEDETRRRWRQWRREKTVT